MSNFLEPFVFYKSTRGANLIFIDRVDNKTCYLRMKYSMEFTAQRQCCVKMLDQGDKGDRKTLLHTVY